jgi:hypothetical protein
VITDQPATWFLSYNHATTHCHHCCQPLTRYYAANHSTGIMHLAITAANRSTGIMHLAITTANHSPSTMKPFTATMLPTTHQVSCNHSLHHCCQSLTKHYTTTHCITAANQPFTKHHATTHCITAANHSPSIMQPLTASRLPITNQVPCNHSLPHCWLPLTTNHPTVHI